MEWIVNVDMTSKNMFSLKCSFGVKCFKKFYMRICFIFRVFGHFEKPLFFELCKHVLTKFLPMGKVLFKPGSVSTINYEEYTYQKAMTVKVCLLFIRYPKGDD